MCDCGGTVFSVDEVVVESGKVEYWLCGVCECGGTVLSEDVAMVKG